MDYFDQTSERLNYRRITKADIPIWTTFFHNNDRLKYLGINLDNSAEESARIWIERQLERYEQQGLGHLAVELKDRGTFIGLGGIIPRVLNDKPFYEITYSLLPKFWGNGYGTELARQMKAYAFGNIGTDTMISIIDKENEASIKVAIKNGMQVLFETDFRGLDVFVYGVKK